MFPQKPQYNALSQNGKNAQLFTFLLLNRISFRELDSVAQVFRPEAFPPRIDTPNFSRVTFLMSRSKATTKTPAQSHILMDTVEFQLKENSIRHELRNKSFQLIPVILSIIVIFTAISCGGGNTPPSTVPVANPGGPYSGNVNQPLAFNGSGSTAPSGRTITSFAWLFGDGANGTGASPSHSYTIAGNYTATLTVTDSSGASGASSVAVQINAAPVAKPGGPYTGKVGVPVTFDGSASTFPPGQVPGYAWNFGDGTTVGPIAQAQTTHTYNSPCTCTVTLTVTVGTGASSFATTTATITAGPGAGGESRPSTFFAIGPAATASSQFAYTLTTPQNGSSSLTIETIDTATGNLQSTDVTPPSLDSDFVPAGMITDPSRRFLYLYGADSIQTFSIASDTGALVPSVTTATNGSPNVISNEVLIFNPNAKFAYFIAQEPNSGNSPAPGSITRFSVDPNTGTLGAIETVSAQVSNPQSSALDPSGKFLYVSGFEPTASNDSTSAAPQIAVLSVAPSTGTLTPISDSPVSIQSGIAATSIAIDFTGRFMYAAGINSTNNSTALSVFSLNSATGELTQSVAPTSLSKILADPSTGESAAAATSLVISASGEFAYVLTSVPLNDFPARQAIQIFELNTQTGAPKFASSTVTNTFTADIVVSTPASLVLFAPAQLSANANNSGFLFVTDPSNATVRLFATDAKTGQLNFRAATNTAAQ